MVQNFVIIEIVREDNDKIIACKIRYIGYDRTEADTVYDQIKTTNKLLLVPNITMDDIPTIRITHQKDR